MVFNLFSRPVELYTFEYDGDVERYTSHNTDISLNGINYRSVTLRRGNLRKTKDSAAENFVTLEMDKASSVPQRFRKIAPAKPLWVTIQKIDKKDIAPGAQAKTLFTGKVRGVDWAKPLAEMQCDSIASMLKRTGLRMNYQTMCNHMQFSEPCGVGQEKYRETDRVLGIDGAKVILAKAAQYEDGWFKLGCLEYGDYYYMIIDHTGSELTLLTAPEALEEGATVDFFAGCDRSLDTCWEKFENGRNFGGCPYVPDANPFRWGI